FAIEKTIDTLNQVLEQSTTVAEIIVIPAIAAYVEDFYSGCERLAERVAVAFDGGLPQGKNWHQQLLQKMGESDRSNRPSLWDQPLLSKLDAYRSFRHRVRHLYNIDLDSEKVLLLARQVPELFEEIKEAVEQFNEWLVQQANKRSE
ncbi:MAG: nucleotidyltransferase domain-containing protein, partial [Cyanobacteria bacterium J06560_2]